MPRGNAPSVLHGLPSLLAVHVPTLCPAPRLSVPVPLEVFPRATSLMVPSCELCAAGALPVWGARILQNPADNPGYQTLLWYVVATRRMWVWAVGRDWAPGEGEGREVHNGRTAGAKAAAPRLDSE